MHDQFDRSAGTHLVTHTFSNTYYNPKANYITHSFSNTYYNSSSNRSSLP